MTSFKKIGILLDKAERKRVGVLLGLTIIGMVVETLGVGMVVPAIALFVQKDLGASYPRLKPALEAIGSPTQQQLVVYGMAALILVYVMKCVFLAFLAWRQTSFTYSVQLRLTQQLLTVYLRQPYSFHLQRNSSQLMRNVSGEIGQLTGVIQHALSLCSESLVLVALTTMLLLVEPLGALIVVLLVGGAAWAFHLATRSRIARWGKLRQYHSGFAIQHLVQGLSGAKDVKLLGREKEFIDQYQFHTAAGARITQMQSTLSQFPRLWLELLAVIGMTTLVFIMLAQGKSVEAIVPTLGLFGVAAFRIMPAMSHILGSVQQLRYSAPAINTISEEFKLESPELPQRSGRRPEFHESVAVSEVFYTYPGAPSPSLKGVSIVVRRGEAVGLIGPSGSGKSTLVDVFLGLLSPGSGMVLLDGVDIRKDMRLWQDQIGYVPQFIYLTDDTIRRNVAFGIPTDQVDEDAVRRAIRAAQLDDFVATLPEGLGTLVGERGVRLSGGQRQRIGMARALYHDPAVLVLDEATSSLDLDTEREVMKAVIALQSSKTVLIVAHRLSTVAHCDRLYRLDDGKVADEGTPAELLEVEMPVLQTQS